MKNIKYIILAMVILMSSLSGCNWLPSDVEPDPGQDSPGTGEVTAVGEPIGQQITQTIGNEGGQINSVDRIISLNIPAGAITKSTNITIVRITSHTPNGLGTSYRFLPDGLQFDKPATLTFNYSNEQISLENPGSLGIAYQKSDGIWYSVVGAKTDTARNEISVQMTHFSDWSDYELSQISKFSLSGPVENEPIILNYGESIAFEVQTLLEPLVSPGKNEIPLSIRESGAVKWSLAGGDRNGSIEADGNQVTYHSPLFAPQQNPVTVSAELSFQNTPKKLILVRQIYVGPGYMKLKFKGKDYLFTLGNLDDSNPGHFMINAGNSRAIAEIQFSGSGVGYFPYGSITDPGKAEIRIQVKNPDGKSSTNFDTGHVFCEGKEWNARGGLTISAYDPTKHLITGKFSGNVIPADADCTSEGPDMTGEFHMTTAF